MAKSTVSHLADLVPNYISIIGGGGKTTLMRCLGRELARRGHSVLLTTTTHLAWPPPEEVFFLSPTAPEELREAAAPGRVVIAGFPSENRRMVGIGDEMMAQAGYDYVICEADGSARLPLKIHKDTEPVLPPCTELVIQVAGLSALGRPSAEVVHRYALMDLAPQEIVTPALVARILSRGWDHIGWNRSAITLLNQADSQEALRAGNAIKALLGHSGETVISALREDPIADALFSQGR